jgi:hypothetical protein
MLGLAPSTSLLSLFRLIFQLGPTEKINSCEVNLAFGEV